jgi:uncharacterized membrane protein
MIQKWKESLTPHHAAVTLLILVGVLLRLRQYLTGRSLWADEAMLALNIVNRDVIGLFKPLDYDQGAPLGFLFVEKVFNLFLGRNEYVLRLFPLLLGIFALGLFYLLLKRIVHSHAGILAALALFVFNPRLIYYSSEVKQYILDVFITIALLLVALPLLEDQASRKNFLQLALAGFLALWFSHPALFVLAGIGLTLVIIYFRRHDRAGLLSVLGMGTLWIATIGFLYLIILKDLRQNAYMQEYWQAGFMPVPPWSNPVWFASVLHENIGLQFGIPYAQYLVLGLMLAGWLYIWTRQRSYAVALGLILLITLIASALQLYPVLERMILFTIPIGLILIGKSIDWLYSLLPDRKSLNVVIAVVLAGLLLYGPFTTSVEYFLNPKYYEHIRLSMENLQSSWKDGDTLYVTNGAVPAFEYYAPMYGFQEISYRTNQRQDYTDRQKITEQLDALNGQPRVWVLMSHVYERDGFNEQDFILDYLRQHGTRKREFRVPGTSVYLYLFDLGG